MAFIYITRLTVSFQMLEPGSVSSLMSSYLDQIKGHIAAVQCSAVLKLSFLNSEEF